MSNLVIQACIEYMVTLEGECSIRRVGDLMYSIPDHTTVVDRCRRAALVATTSLADPHDSLACDYASADAAVEVMVAEVLSPLLAMLKRGDVAGAVAALDRCWA